LGLDLLRMGGCHGRLLRRRCIPWATFEALRGGDQDEVSAGKLTYYYEKSSKDVVLHALSVGDLDEMR
jgi:hypothetical protein